MDNAATSFPKPRRVLEAMVRYANELGASAGRGSYREAVDTASLLSQCRQRLCRLFNGERPEHFIFTLNCSDALNLAIHGLIDLSRKNHAICTEIDHNSILRPLNELAERGWIAQTCVPVDSSTGLVDPDDIRRAIRSDTRLIAITHVSNVTGTVQPIRQIAEIAREHDVPLVVDAAQSAGHLPIDVQADMIDLLAAPGHKALFGPLGTGLLYIRPGIERMLRPIRQGGTGSISEEPRQPDFLPDRYEPGSLVRVRRNNDYWERDLEGGHLPYLDRIDYVIMEDPFAMDLAFRTGRLDGGARGLGHYLTTERKEGYVRDLGDDVFFMHMDGGNFRLAFNVLKPGPWQDVRVRRAIALWIDKRAAIPGSLGGFGWTTPDLVPPDYQAELAKLAGRTITEQTALDMS
jgi:hypothetical protein